MHLVGSYTYCRMMHGAYNVRFGYELYKNPCQPLRKRLCLFITFHSYGLRVFQDVIKFHEGVWSPAVCIHYYMFTHFVQKLPYKCHLSRSRSLHCRCLFLNSYPLTCPLFREDVLSVLQQRIGFVANRQRTRLSHFLTV